METIIRENGKLVRIETGVGTSSVTITGDEVTRLMRVPTTLLVAKGIEFDLDIKSKDEFDIKSTYEGTLSDSVGSLTTCIADCYTYGIDWSILPVSYVLGKKGNISNDLSKLSKYQGVNNITLIRVRECEDDNGVYRISEAVLSPCTIINNSDVLNSVFDTNPTRDEVVCWSEISDHSYLPAILS